MEPSSRAEPLVALQNRGVHNVGGPATHTTMGDDCILRFGSTCRSDCSLCKGKLWWNVAGGVVVEGSGGSATFVAGSVLASRSCWLRTETGGL